MPLLWILPHSLPAASHFPFFKEPVPTNADPLFEKQRKFQRLSLTYVDFSAVAGVWNWLLQNLVWGKWERLPQPLVFYWIHQWTNRMSIGVGCAEVQGSLFREGAPTWFPAPLLSSHSPSHSAESSFLGEPFQGAQGLPGRRGRKFSFHPPFSAGISLIKN